MNRENFYTKGKVELRAVNKEQEESGFIGVIEGFIPYESESRQLRDSRGKVFVERFSRGAFSKSLTNPEQTVFADVGHNDAATFARSGVNLEIKETADGVSYTALLPDTTTGRDLKKNVELRIIDGTSFEFEINDTASQSWEKRGEIAVRTIKNAILHRLNPVTEPAYLSSSLSLRSVQVPDAVAEPISNNSTGLVGALIGFF